MLGPKPEDMYAPTRRAIEDGLWAVLGAVAYGLLLALVGTGVVALASLYELDTTFDLGRGIEKQRRD